jgi:probable rRNA maturation factor
MRFAGKIESIKNDILGKQYSLSIAYVSEKKSRELNKKYRKKDRATNVLSFSLKKNMGELILCPAVIKREVKSQEKQSAKNFGQYLGFLVIHGMLHLKEMIHGSTMERAEHLYYKKYDQKFFGGNRRRVLDDESRGGRIQKGRKKS